MQSSRFVVCGAPHAGRVCRLVTSAAARHASSWPAPFLARSPSGNDFAPLFRLIDESSNRAFENFFPQVARAQAEIYQPRFDVREIDGAYELRGELPGVDSKDIQVEFANDQTLTIKGRTERESSNGNQDTTTQAVTQEEQQPDNASDTASVLSNSSYQKPSVEDEGAEISNTSGRATPTESLAADEQPSQALKHQHQRQQSEAPATRYWVSERSVGEFQRTFNFPVRVDQDAVKASLRNGILSLKVPKAAEPVAKRINIA